MGQGTAGVCLRTHAPVVGVLTPHCLGSSEAVVNAVGAWRLSNLSFGQQRHRVILSTFARGRLPLSEAARTVPTCCPPLIGRSGPLRSRAVSVVRRTPLRCLLGGQRKAYAAGRPNDGISYIRPSLREALGGIIIIRGLRSEL
jgi:hypothetical protein